MDKQAIYNYDVAPVDQETSSGDMTAEQMAVVNYDILHSRVAKRIEHAKGDPKEEEVVTREVDAICNEIENLIGDQEIKEDKKEFRALRILLSKFKKFRNRFPEAKAKIDEEQAMQGESALPPPPPPPPITPVHQMSSSRDMIRRASLRIDDQDLRKDVIDDYTERIIKCLSHKHDFVPSSDGTAIVLSDGDNKLMIGVNDQCMVDEIVPMGSLAKECPLHSSRFYQRYLKPITEAIGHLYMDDNDSLIVIGKSDLPDYSKDHEQFISVLSIKEKRAKRLRLFFHDDTWSWATKSISTGREPMTVEAQTNEPLSEKDFFNKRVKCIDPAQETIFSKIGEVKQIIPRADCIELDVNFGRHIVRVTDSQVEIIYDL